MAKFCDDDCEAICDFCKHYDDEFRYINGQFAGDGTCNVDGKLVDACDGYKCDNFKCFRLE